MKKILLVSLLFFPLVTLASFDSNLQYGSTGNSVTELQEFLTIQGNYAGPITGNFYSLTRQGVINFQTTNNISPAAGYFGPITRAKANLILDAQESASNQQAVLETGSITTPTQNDAANTLQAQINLLLAQVQQLNTQVQAQTNIQQQTQTTLQQTQQTIQQVQQNTEQIQQNTTQPIVVIPPQSPVITPPPAPTPIATPTQVSIWDIDIHFSYSVSISDYSDPSNTSTYSWGELNGNKIILFRFDSNYNSRNKIQVSLNEITKETDYGGVEFQNIPSGNYSLKLKVIKGDRYGILERNINVPVGLAGSSPNGDLCSNNSCLY